MSNGCGCQVAGNGPKLVFACSGAADVGALADQAARQLTRDGAGKMYCLAGVGGRVRDIMETTERAAAILAIDGCSLDCAKSCLEGAGFKRYAHLRISELGLEKGATPINAETIGRVATRARELLSRPMPS
jgi:uncharacterized metal-binding protein